jgi:hypothetical protein
MNPDQSLPETHLREDMSWADRRSPAWGAIFAGAVAGLGTHFLLLMLLTAVGLGSANPATDENPVATFGIGTAIAWSLSALIALFAGGWVAGRCAARVHSVSGAMHGFLVWCVSTIAALVLVTSGARALIGGAASVVGQGISALGRPLAGAADLAKEAVAQNTSSIAGMIDEIAQNPDVKNAAAARREVGQALRELFREGGDLSDPQARTAVVQALTRSGMVEADASRMVDNWISSMQQMRARFEQTKAAAAAKAREVADTASRGIAKAALWAFIGSVLGAIAATMGGRGGQMWEYNHTEISSDASLNPAQRRATIAAHVPRHA